MVMKLKPEGTWRNSDGSIKMILLYIPGKSDVYSVIYSVGENVSKGQIHLSNTDDIIWHITANDVLGTGFLKFISNEEIEIKTSKIDNMRLKRDLGF
jgi:hypothetical protein